MTWKHILKSLPIIAQWLSWSPGSGQSINIGKDMILGLGPSALLSPMLITELSQRNINLLYQASGGTRSGSNGTSGKIVMNLHSGVWLQNGTDTAGFYQDLVYVCRTKMMNFSGLEVTNLVF
jgi:hypothetical protein